MAFEDVWVITSNDVNQMGLVRYPQLFKTSNQCVEDLMEQVGYPYDVLIDHGFGFPIVHAEADYASFIESGEEVALELVPEPGDESVSFTSKGYVAEEPAFTVTQTHAMVEIKDVDEYTATELPYDLRTELRSIES
jgi:acyl-CoA thioesterase FadM